jgi:phosphate-selective porin OprO/OprP
LGQHNPFQSLEELTSSLATSFMERAAFTDAFNFRRRVGISGSYAAGDIVASAGVFTDNISDLADNSDRTGLGDENKSVGGDARLVYAPKIGDAQLHFGGSAHLRDTGNIAEFGGTTRYRQRPFVHTTNTRFIGTPALRVTRETHGGLEAAFIRGPLHGAGEVHWFRPEILGRTEDPTFFGGYAELGYFLTGETRGYRNGQFDRTKVLRPVGDGGFGAFQVNLRYDHLDLSDAGILGGRQHGYEASLIWIPQDHVRFLLNYGHLDYRDTAIPAANGDRSYGVDVVAARAQVDF